MNLKKNKVYSSSDLIALFGGNIQSSMPMINGVVPYCKFNPKINPLFPNEAWIEEGPIRKKSANYLINSNFKIPIFKKIKTNQWKYIGKACIKDYTSPQRLNDINQSPPRNFVQIILGLDFNK